MKSCAEKRACLNPTDFHRFFDDAYPVTQRVAGVHAAAVVKSHGLSSQDRQDLRQEGLAELWRKFQFFDASRASWSTFAERVIANRLTSCMRSIHALRRGHGLHESIDEVKRVPLAPDERVELRADVMKVLGCVSRLDRAVALSLIDNSPSETSHHLEVPRSTVYRAIGRLRVAFTAAGLSPASSVCRQNSKILIALRQHEARQ